MRKSASALVLVLLFTLAGCGSSSDSGDTVAGEVASDVALDGELEETTPVVVDLPWVAVDGGELSGVKSVRGLTCAGNSIYLAVDGEATGTYVKDLTLTDPLTKVFEGTGLLASTESGILVASYTPNATTALVLLAPDLTATDQGFAEQGIEVKDLVYTGGDVYMMGKDWNSAEYLVYRGGLGLMAFEQVGLRTNETAMSFYSDGETLYLMTILNGTLGSGCRQIAASAGASDTWTACAGFPEWVQSKTTDPYSIKAEVFGFESDLGAWFRVSNKGVNEYHMYAGSDASYAELAGFPVLEPTAWHHTGKDVFLGYSGGAGKSGVYAASVSSGAARNLTEGLPSAAHEKDGVVAFCQSDDRLVAAWFAFGGGGSTVTLLQKTLN